MVYTKENIMDGIYAKIDAMPNVDEADKEIWRRRLVQYPKEIEQNVLEWVNNLPITEVDCHGESIKKTMDRWGLDKDCIPSVINGFVKFKKGNFRTPSIIVKAICVESDFL